MTCPGHVKQLLQLHMNKSDLILSSQHFPVTMCHLLNITVELTCIHILKPLKKETPQRRQTNPPEQADFMSRKMVQKLLWLVHQKQRRVPQ